MEIINNFSAIEITHFSHLVSAWTIKASQNHEAVLPQTPEKIASQMASNLSHLAFDEHGNPIGHITNWHLVNHHFETGTLYVSPENRNLKIGLALCFAAAASLTDRYLLATTKNPKAVKAFVHSGYQIASYSSVTPEVRQNLCYTAPCFSHNGHKDVCIFQDNKCKLLVRNPLC